MTTVQYILIIIAVVIMVVGLFMIIRGFRNRQNADLPQAAIAEKNGIPIVPRHERHVDNAPESEVETLHGQEHPEGHLKDKPVINTDQISQVNTAANRDDFDRPVNDRRADATGNSSESEYANEQERELGKTWQEQQQIEDSQLFQSASKQIGNTQRDDSQPSHSSNSDEEHDDLFSSFASATENLMSVIETVEEPEFNQNSPMLDQHLLAAVDQDQNSPLNHAEENINITLTPHNSADTIQGSTVLSLVEQYGLKYGAMNMFHRYENKNGTGILWFSMMGMTDDGIAPFDLNSLPNATFKGLVLFLSLPHPKAMQGFDSMMSIVGLIAKQLDAQVLDENNQPLTRERRQQLRNQVQEYHATRF